MQVLGNTDIFSIESDDAFDAHALRLFHLHAAENKVYQAFLKGLNINVQDVEHVDQIPMLPIELFKKHRILLGDPNLPAETVFRSSGTSGLTQSEHHIANIDIYEQSFTHGFELHYGPVEQYRILALLPSYLERNDSSLVYMVNELIKSSNDELSGTYLDQYHRLTSILQRSEEEKQPTLLIGVSFALLELAAQAPMQLNHTTLIETGGMKGRRKEMVREELHQTLTDAFGVSAIHSEYGMTELLSQAWSSGNGSFTAPPWMRVFTRDTTDPLVPAAIGKTGGLNVIDLANAYSCPFIATEDLGKVHKNGQFEVLGRFDQSDVRGCNLLVI